jgi:hypothetical protein
MSAPKTNIQKQKRRHWGPLLGIALALIVATLLFLWLMGYLADTETPDPAPAPVVEQEGGLPAGGAPESPMSPEVEATPVETMPAPAQD